MVKANYKPGLLENAVGQTSDGNFLFPASTKGGKMGRFLENFGERLESWILFGAIGVSENAGLLHINV